MAFIKKQGYWVSENGWPMCDTNELDYGAIPDVGMKLGVRIGEPNAILKALICRLHREVEPAIVSQIGCYTATNSMRNSNHNSATAIDFNWGKHPWKVRGTWGALKQKVDRIVADFRGVVEWGGYWSDSYVDEMHFEMHFAPGHQGTIDLARELWSDGLWDIWKPGVRPPSTPAPPTTVYFLLTIGSTGDTVRKLQAQMKEVFRSYAGHLEVDGIYGPRTAAAVAEFQRRTGIGVDGDVGPITRTTLKKYGVIL
ncbi:lysin A [Mycobacterium phage JacoRen57]|nr:lysin A [Mycobacterium phage JacoRen57]